MSKIAVHSPQEIVPLDNARLREIARSVLNGEEIQDYEISLAFVDNATIHRLNKQYLNHDEPTDVLSFPYSAANAKKLEGELVIGVEIALEQAKEREHNVEAELALYVIHGLLHLCGYGDKSSDDEKSMRERERHYLGVMGLPIITENS
jgi:probable rRNA maturation factor